MTPSETVPRLSAQTLARLPSQVRQPDYDREAQACGIVHLGLGAFHKAHQAVYTDDAMNAGGRDWAITGVSLRALDVQTALAPQDGLYSVSERGPGAAGPRVIGAMRRVLAARSDPHAVVTAIAAQETRLVSLTVTEKGYADVGAGSIYDYLGRALAQRHALGRAGLTLLSCDNLAGNGARLGAALEQHLERLDPALARWFRAECRCPSSMVDRIVPATHPPALATVAATLGLYDAGAVVTEPFRQWVIEDRFAGPRPRWEAGGAQFVSDVRPYEAAKLRMLNGAHSALAYLGLARGHEYVHQAIADSTIAPLIDDLLRREAAPTLPPLQLDLDDYADDLLARFANASLAHRLQQIAIDGSQKIPQRWLDTLAWHDRVDQSCPALLQAMAAWIVFVRGDGHAVDDPLAAHLAGLWREHGRGGIVAALFGAHGLFAGRWTCRPADAVTLDALLDRIG